MTTNYSLSAVEERRLNQAMSCLTAKRASAEPCDYFSCNNKFLKLAELLKYFDDCKVTRKKRASNMALFGVPYADGETEQIKIARAEHVQDFLYGVVDTCLQNVPPLSSTDHNMLKKAYGNDDSKLIKMSSVLGIPPELIKTAGLYPLARGAGKGLYRLGNRLFRRAPKVVTKPNVVVDDVAETTVKNIPPNPKEVPYQSLDPSKFKITRSKNWEDALNASNQAENLVKKTPVVNTAKQTAQQTAKQTAQQTAKQTEQQTAKQTATKAAPSTVNNYYYAPQATAEAAETAAKATAKKPGIIRRAVGYTVPTVVAGGTSAGTAAYMMGGVKEKLDKTAEKLLGEVTGARSEINNAIKNYTGGGIEGAIGKYWPLLIALAGGAGLGALGDRALGGSGVAGGIGGLGLPLLLYLLSQNTDWGKQNIPWFSPDYWSAEKTPAAAATGTAETATETETPEATLPAEVPAAPVPEATPPTPVPASEATIPPVTPPVSEATTGVLK
jgi:hypothetical protein